MADRIEILGLTELEDALKELPKATARNVLIRTLTAEGRRIADAGHDNAPTRPGKSTGPLKESYAVGTKLSPRQAGLLVKLSEVEVYVGPGPLVEAIQTEFGNVHQAPEPHLRPAWDANVEATFRGIAKTLELEIDKAVSRIAAKAARAAAK